MTKKDDDVFLVILGAIGLALALLFIKSLPSLISPKVVSNSESWEMVRDSTGRLKSVVVHRRVLEGEEDVKG